MTKKFLAAVAATLVATAGAATPAEAATTITANCFFPPSHYVCTKILIDWKTQVEEATNGRVQVQTYATSMAPPGAQLTSVRNGVFDVAFQYNGLVEKQIPATNVSLLPFVSSASSEANSVAMWRTYDKYLRDYKGYRSVHVLGYFVMGGHDFFSIKNPITSLDDLSKMKIWAVPGPTADLLKKTGSAVISGPAVEMTELVQNRVVDGFVGVSEVTANDLSLYSYVKSKTVTNRGKLVAPSFSFIINEGVWKKLSDEDQQKITEVSGEAFSRAAGHAWDELSSKVKQEKEANLEIIDASDELESQLMDLGEGLIEDWQKTVAKQDVDGAALLQFYRDKATEIAGEVAARGGAD